MKIDESIHQLQKTIGVKPKWEKDLIETDSHLQTYLKWKEQKYVPDNMCDELYSTRLNYLKGCSISEKTTKP